MPLAGTGAIRIGAHGCDHGWQALAGPLVLMLEGRRFTVEHIAESALRLQFEPATDSTEKTFVALMLGASYGDAIAAAPIAQQFSLKLKTVAEYARPRAWQGGDYRVIVV